MASQAMPGLPVQFASDTYYELDRADFFRDEAKKRADGTQSAGGGFKTSTSPYSVDVWAFHKDVTDRQRANADSQIMLDNSATQYVMHKLLIRKERQFVDTWFKTGVWDNNVDGGDWTGTSADPIEEIRTAIRTVQGKTGFKPNRLLFSRLAWDYFVDNDAVLERILGGATVDRPAFVKRQMVANEFEIDWVGVLEAVYNSAEEGATESTGFVSSAAQVLIYYAPMSVGSTQEPTAGVVFNWTGFMGATNNGLRVKKFRRPEEFETDRIEGQMAFDMKTTGSELGYMLHSLGS